MGFTNSLLVMVLATFTALHISQTESTELIMRAHVGSTVTLPCKVDVDQCGSLHSVKWYRDTSRIYVISKGGLISQPEGDARERMKVEYDRINAQAFLEISPVEVLDEATYKCEITYLEVRDNCDVVEIVRLITLVKPADVVILIGNEDVNYSNTSDIGPYVEDTKIELTCKAINGKPIPRVTWYNGSEILTRAKYSTHDEVNGVGTGVSNLALTLSRGDLTSHFECRVESNALETPTISWIKMDVHVPPTKMVLEGLTGPVVQGTNIELICDVFGARPAATIQWFNGSQDITDSPLVEITPEENVEDEKDNTVNTKSSLRFNASRYENGEQFHCYGENEVTKERKLPKMHYFKKMDIRFPPVINVSAQRIVVREHEKVVFPCSYFSNPQRLLDAAWLKDGKNLTRVEGKHRNGYINVTSLQIIDATRDDIGDYNCWLKNEAGASISENSITLDVHYVPDVEVIMEPSTPVKATDKGNVTLECNVTSGNPAVLKKVRWFLGDDLMTELPYCNDTLSNDTQGGPLCGIEPSILSLMKVGRSFAGNYSCQGENEAGWGPKSDPQELIVYYAPSPAKLWLYPEKKVIKKSSVTLVCSVDDPGRPNNLTYLWFRGSNIPLNITGGNVTIRQASLETRSNFTCIAVNEGGQSQPATRFIDVLAPPSFIGTLVPYKGVLYSSNNVSLTCVVECYPLCSIIWYKDGKYLDTNNNSLYYVDVKEHKADSHKQEFESIESTLVWNMTNWPNQQLNKSAGHSNYTCISKSKESFALSINFTTEIAVDFPPEDLTVSQHLVNVIENDIPPAVKCSGKGRPQLSYLWRRNFTSNPLDKSDTLRLDKMTRSDAGSYICEAFNKYGSATAKVYFDVWYKPECSISLAKWKGNRALRCTAHGKPEKVSFQWRINDSNETYIDYDQFEQDGISSYVIIDSSIDTTRVYQCIANNSVGASIPCQGKVDGVEPWYAGKERLIIIIASIIALVICVLIVCIVIIALCRRKRRNTKYNNPMEMEEREKSRQSYCSPRPDGQSPDTSGQSKWPLKSGLLVHVNKMNHINISQLTPQLTPFKSTSVKNSAFLKYRRKKSKIYARLQRLGDLLRLSGRSRVPSGITEGASGVVTYKKILTTNPKPEQVNSRKRKKPGYPPNQSSVGDKARLGAAPPPLGGTADPTTIIDPDKGFYENLPFHGMQNPPNKPISVIAPFLQASNFNVSTKSLYPQYPQNHQAAFTPVNNNNKIQRHQSFHGFQDNKSVNALLFTANQQNFSNPHLCNFPQYPKPILNFNPSLAPNPFSIPPRRVVGRRESDVRRTASGINPPKLPENPPIDIKVKRFGSLELKKHKCYSPTFYSMRCKKHAKKRPVVYALPKKVLKDLPNTEVIKVEDNPDLYQNLTDSIQYFEQTEEERKEQKAPIPAPRKKSRDIVYQNLSPSEDREIANSSTESSENLEGEVSVIEAQVHQGKDSKDLIDEVKDVNQELDVQNHAKDPNPQTSHHIGNQTLPQNISTSTPNQSMISLAHFSDQSFQSIENKSSPAKNQTNPFTINPAFYTPNPFTPKLVGVSPKITPQTMKNSPTLKVSPNFIKPKTESPKGALSLQIQAKRKAVSPNPKSNPNPDRDPSTNFTPNTNRNPNPNTNTNFNPNTNPHSNPNFNLHSNYNSNPNSNHSSNPNSNHNYNPNSNHNSNPNSNHNFNRNSNCNPNPNSNHNSNPIPNHNSYPIPNHSSKPNTNINPNSNLNPNQNPSSDDSSKENFPVVPQMPLLNTHQWIPNRFTQSYRPDMTDWDYADVDYKSYGPINYKAASMYAAMKRNKNTNKMEEVNKNKPYDDLL